jgi:mono/diheme cytochrome c family protein
MPTRTLVSLLVVALSAVAVRGEEPVLFENQVRPLLKAHCFECHGDGTKLKGGLDLRLRRTISEGGDSGPAVVPGKAADSLLIRRVRSGEMPPGKRKLTKSEIAVLERWIAGGAVVSHAEPQELPTGFSLSPLDLEHWAFQPIRPISPPSEGRSGNRSVVRNPIDAFLLAKLEAKGLSFGPEADRRTLIRRASFDLLGLPPTPVEVEAYVGDASGDAYEKMIDRLLASPHYGERWGRHWLDVAGYADSEGFSGTDPVRATAYRYRDYVIRMFNADRPWNEFIVEQLAGDELVRPPYETLPPGELDKLIATGFLRMAPDGTASPGVDVKAASNQNVADTIQIVATSLMGLTLHCAQCHNHRYDPIPQADYYHVRAIFEPALNVKSWRTPAGREVPLFKDEDRRKADAIEKEAQKIDAERSGKLKGYIAATFEKQLAKLPKELHERARAMHATAPAKRSAEQQKLLMQYPFLNVTDGSLYLYDSKAAANLKQYATQAAKLRATKPVPEYVRALTEPAGAVPVTYRFERGDYESPKEAVGPASLLILDRFGLRQLPAKDRALPSTGRRLAFARSLVSGKHPLTARVLVNRFWMHHFGKGIVGTPGDFGLLGERPTHPELLDWLACDFMDGGWRLKRLHRLIMTSTAYRQAAQRRPELERIDPDNRLLGRMPVRRLEAETIRDAMLAVSGALNDKAFGPPVPVTHDEIGQVVIGKDIRNPGDGTPMGKVAALGGEEFRRSVYIQVRRSLPLAMLETFDAAMATPNCEARSFSTVATQALLLMNNRQVLEQAALFAQRVRRQAGADARAQVVLAWRLAYAAEPTAEEIEGATSFLARQTAHFGAQKRGPADPEPALQALASFCQALLGSNRFLYVD